MSPRRCDVIASVGKVWGFVLTCDRLVSPLVPAQAAIQRWVPASAGTSGRSRVLGLVLLGGAALALSACGRVGPLEPPPGPVAVPASRAQLTQPDGSPAPGSAQDTAAKSGFDAQGNPVATPSQKRTFILDPLLR
jgi:predicted small lipoprotein YifL